VTQATPQAPLSSQRAESWLVGAAMKRPSDVLPHTTELTPDDFSREDYRHIWEAISALVQRRAPVSVVSVAEECIARQTIGIVGGPAQLDQLAAEVDTTAGKSVEFYRGQVARLARLRRHAASLATEAAAAYGDEARKDPDGFIASSLSRVGQASSETKVGGLRPLADVATEAWQSLNERLSSEWSAGLPVGLPGVSQALTLHKGDLLCLAAPPGTGKTAATLQMLHAHAATGLGWCAMFSLEMPDEQLVFRLAAERSGVSTHDIRTGKLTRDQLAAVSSALGKLSESRILVDSTPGLTIEQIAARVRRAKFQHGNICSVAVDYLQLMGRSKTLSRDTSKNDWVGHNAQGLKELAKTEGTVVVMLSQLSRGFLKLGREPDLHDLRASGEIEQALDAALFLHRERDDSQQNHGGPPSSEWGLTLLLQKQRNGPRGRWSARFHGPSMTIREAT